MQYLNVTKDEEQMISFLEDKDHPAHKKKQKENFKHSFNKKYKVKGKYEEKDVIRNMPQKKTYFASLESKIQKEKKSDRKD